MFPTGETNQEAVVCFDNYSQTTGYSDTDNEIKVSSNVGAFL